MFGALGIVIGPVLMIVIVTTISVYLAVYKGVPLEQHDDDESSPKKKRRLRRLDASGHDARSRRRPNRTPRAPEEDARPAKPALR